MIFFFNDTAATEIYTLSLHDALPICIDTSQDTAQRVSEILTSLERFETGHLGIASSGSKTLYEELNRLITKNGLRISGGINFTQLQEAGPGAENAQRARRQSGETSAQQIGRA